MENQIKPLRTRTKGDNESWLAWAMFDGKHAIADVREVVDELMPFGGGAPGRQFAREPIVYRRGKFIFAQQFGGMDV